MASRTTGSETTNYTFDVFGNLLTVTMPDKTISYIVDGHDRRSAKLVDSTVVSRYLWQSQYRLAAELNADGTMRKQFVYGDGVNSPEYMIYQGKRYHLVKDHRGSVNLVVDVNSGTIEQKITYSEFGEVLSDTNPGFQPFGFAGGLYDSDTKLVRFGARDYDGKIGRWLAKDPISFAGGDENLYGYVLNDPVNLVDPAGLQESDASIGGPAAEILSQWDSDIACFKVDLDIAERQWRLSQMRKQIEYNSRANRARTRQNANDLQDFLNPNKK